MKIALDLRACQFPNYATRGIGLYAKNLANAILSYDRRRDYALFGYRGIGEFLGYNKENNVSEVEMFGFLPLLPNQRTFQRRKSLESAYFNHLIKKHHVDVVLSFLSADCQVKVDVRKTCTLVRIFYDLIPILFANHYFVNNKGRAQYVNNLKEFENSDTIITISHNSKKDLLQHVHFNAHNIKVIYPGIHEYHFSDDRSSDEQLAAYGIHGKFLLYVGGYDFRKNVESIVDAFARQGKNIQNDFHLVFVGEIGQPQKEKLTALARKHSIVNAIVFTGFVPDRDLPYFYRHAVALIYPSFYEGFGLTVLEAMANHCAVITSNNSSLGEVAKNFALTFDPTNIDEISRAMNRIISDDELRNNVINRAFEYAKTYSWETTARETIAFLEQSVLSNKKQLRV